MKFLISLKNFEKNARKFLINFRNFEEVFGGMKRKILNKSV